MNYLNREHKFQSICSSQLFLGYISSECNIPISNSRLYSFLRTLTQGLEYKYMLVSIYRPRKFYLREKGSLTNPLNKFSYRYRLYLNSHALNHFSGHFVFMFGLATCWLFPCLTKEALFMMNFFALLTARPF